MIGSVSPAMHKYLWKPAWWVIRHKFFRFWKKKKYSMYELKAVRDYRDGKLTAEQLDQCSTCDLCTSAKDGLPDESRECLKRASGEEPVKRDLVEQQTEE
jgi:hypothetical protein